MPSTDNPGYPSPNADLVRHLVEVHGFIEDRLAFKTWTQLDSIHAFDHFTIGEPLSRNDRSGAS